MHEDLKAKARDSSREARSELLEQLTMAVIQSGSATPKELELYFEIVRDLLHEAGVNARIYLAEHLQKVQRVPLSLLKELVADVIEVAGPVLRRVSGFPPNYLIELAGTLAIPYLCELAARERLSIPVTDTLMERGDISVMRRLSQNTTSELSRSSLKKLVEVSSDDDDVCRGMASRSDLPPEDADRIVRRMTTLLRNRMTKRPAAPAPARAAVVVEEAPPAGVSATRHKVPKRADVLELVRQVREKLVTLDDVLGQLSEEDRTNDIAVALARLCDLDEMAIMKVLIRKEAHGIAMVCKALNISDAAWRELVAFRERRLKLSTFEVKFEWSDYQDLNVEECRATLAQFQNKRTRQA